MKINTDSSVLFPKWFLVSAYLCLSQNARPSIIFNQVKPRPGRHFVYGKVVCKLKGIGIM
jgi:hypothetical protein